VHHVKQPVVTPAALDVVTDAARLKIGDDDLGGIFGPDKAAVELRYGKQLPVPNGDKDIGRDAVTPFG
jgi:hypothetical protein